MGLQILLFVVGFVLLYFGAEWLVKGSANLARSLGVTPIVIGLTVVAFGTSSPELVVSLISSLTGKSMIAVGNVVGSNICNIALVLGAAAVFMPMTADRTVLRRDIPLMLGISVYLLIVSADSTISRLEGASLLVGIILYTVFNYRVSMRETRLAGAGSDRNSATLGIQSAAGSRLSTDAERHPKEVELNQGGEIHPAAAIKMEEIAIVESRTKQIFLILIGIAGVVIGAKVLIDAAEVIMKAFGLSEKFIGLTVVALGTSLPELATSIVATMRKEMDISIGNLVGSNVFNILAVLGVAGLVRPISIPGGFFQSGLIYDYLMMILTSSLPLVLMFKDHTIRRSGGLLLLGCYGAYLVYLVFTG